MDLNRLGSQITIDLDKPEDAAGLFAFMTNAPATVPPEVFAKGQQIYAWFFENLQTLATNFERETVRTAAPKAKRK